MATFDSATLSSTAAIPPLLRTPENMMMVATLQSAWVSFAKSGTPAAGFWRAYDAEDKAM